MALQLGYVDIDLMLSTITAKQLQGWMDYYSIEPFGYHVENARHGVTETKSTKTYNSNKQQTWEDQLNIVQLINSAYSKFTK